MRGLGRRPCMLRSYFVQADSGHVCPVVCARIGCLPGFSRAPWGTALSLTRAGAARVARSFLARRAAGLGRIISAGRMLFDFESHLFSSLTQTVRWEER